MHELIGGTFVSVKPQVVSDFFNKFGNCRRVSKSLPGTHWTQKNTMIDDKTIHVKVECQEYPAYLVDITLHEGKEDDLVNGFSSQIGITVEFFANNKLRKTTPYKGVGTLIMTEVYDETGATRTWECPELGITPACERLDRYVDMDGFYRFKSGKGYQGFPSLFTGIDFEMIEKPGYKFSVENQGDAIKTVVFLYSKELTSTTKFGEETFHPIQNEVSILNVLKGPGKVLTTYKHKDGRVQEALKTYDGDELVIDYKDQETGKVCQVVFEKYHDFSGTYKKICNYGGEAMAKASGVDGAKLKALVNDPDTTIKVEHNGININSTMTFGGFSKKLEFKLGEEYEENNPILPGATFKCLSTILDNKIIMVGKRKGRSYKRVFMVTKNFANLEVEIIGTGMKHVTTFERV